MEGRVFRGGSGRENEENVVCSTNCRGWPSSPRSTNKGINFLLISTVHWLIGGCEQTLSCRESSTVHSKHESCKLIISKVIMPGKSIATLRVLSGRNL